MVASCNENNEALGLLRRVRNDLDGSATNGVVLNNLLEHFYRGLPVSNVVMLIESKNPNVVRAGAWLLAEIGAPICELLDKFGLLLDSCDEKVRFLVVDCVILCAAQDDGALTFRVIELLDDLSPAVRWKAMDALVKFDNRQIESAQTWVLENRPDCGAIETIRLLTDGADDSIRRAASEPNVTALVKRLAFVAAIRTDFTHDELVRIANIIDDGDVFDFLEDFHR